MVKPDHSSHKNTSESKGNRCLVFSGLVALFACAVCVFSPFLSSFENKITLPEGTARVAGGVSTVDFSSEECQDFRSQFAQDAHLFIKYWAFPKVKTNRVFLEIGALDGVTYSNSYWYERCLGWTGVLIEGHPVAAEKLRQNRPNATIFEAAACGKDEGTVTFLGEANGNSGDPTQMPEDFKKQYHEAYLNGEKGETNEIQCRRLGSMLEETGVKNIDFWTLDVEGAEWTVLHSFDWDKVAVHILLIESDKDEAVEYGRRHAFLESKGMQFVNRVDIDEVWINPSYPNLQSKS